ncbi:hypothetical protein D9758_007649 [Tetrapyrgos nigripes]|uniref:Uncharacterized protein n=1 Tax=Tetrapyrgos nigripes TaxID=182062 RepID=A0A8H5G866_9AGAR|nr:hypothetical protein D9758_007649 [Tetrapyrgos nigripes]
MQQPMSPPSAPFPHLSNPVVTKEDIEKAIRDVWAFDVAQATLDDGMAMRKTAEQILTSGSDEDILNTVGVRVTPGENLDVNEVKSVLDELRKEWFRLVERERKGKEDPLGRKLLWKAMGICQKVIDRR